MSDHEIDSPPTTPSEADIPEVVIESDHAEEMLFPVDKAPHPLLWPIFAVQYLLIAIPTILAVSVLVAEQLGVPGDVRSEVFSIGMFTCGISTIIQIIIGNRLPTLEGVNGVYIVSIAAIVQSNRFNFEDETIERVQSAHNVSNSSLEEPWKRKMTEIQGNLLLASLTHILLGATGVTGFLLRFIGPVTLAPTIMLVGVSIAEFMVPLCESHWGIASISGSLVVIFSLLMGGIAIPIRVSRDKISSIIRYPIFQLNSVFLAVGLSWLLCYTLTITDVLPGNSTTSGQRVRTDAMSDVMTSTPWIYIPIPFKFGMPTFSVSGYAGMLTVNLITILELIGGYFAVARVSNTAPPPMHAVNRGVAINGLSCAICSVFGNIAGNVPYLNILGTIAVTKVASRAVFLTSGVLLVLFGVFGKFGAALALMPDPVIGGINLVTLAMLVSVGISLLQQVQLSSSRNLMIIGLCIVLGLKIPVWIVDNEGAIVTGNTEVDQVLTVLLSTPMFVTGVVGCLLDNIAPGTQKERGLATWRHSSSEEDDKKYSTSGEIYNLPLITRLLRHIRCCAYCPTSPTFYDKTDLCPCRRKLKDEDEFSEINTDSFNYDNRSFDCSLEKNIFTTESQVLEKDKIIISHL